MKYNLSLIFGGLLLTTAACSSRHHVPVNITGLWKAQATINGKTSVAYLNVGQHQGQIDAPGGTFTLDYKATMSARVTGSIGGDSGKEVRLTVIEPADGLTPATGTPCGDAWGLSGEVSGSTMLLRLSGEGNNVPGTTCYPSPIDVTLAFNKVS